MNIALPTPEAAEWFRWLFPTLTDSGTEPVAPDVDLGHAAGQLQLAVGDGVRPREPAADGWRVHPRPGGQPLELGSGLAALAEFASGLDPRFADFNKSWTKTWVLWEEQKLTFSIGPAKLLGFVCGVVIIYLLYRNINDLGRLTVTFGLGRLGDPGIPLVTRVYAAQAAVLALCGCILVLSALFAERRHHVRALENGMAIRVLAGARPSWGVDTIEDAEVMAARLSAASISGGHR